MPSDDQFTPPSQLPKDFTSVPSCPVQDPPFNPMPGFIVGGTLVTILLISASAIILAYWIRARTDRLIRRDKVNAEANKGAVAIQVKELAAKVDNLNGYMTGKDFIELSRSA